MDVNLGSASQVGGCGFQKQTIHSIHPTYGVFLQATKNSIRGKPLRFLQDVETNGYLSHADSVQPADLRKAGMSLERNWTFEEIICSEPWIPSPSHGIGTHGLRCSDGELVANHKIRVVDACGMIGE